MAGAPNLYHLARRLPLQVDAGHTFTRNQYHTLPRALQPPLPLRIERYPLGVIPAIHHHGEPCL